MLKVCSPIVSNPAVTVSVSSCRARRISPVIQSFSKAYLCVPGIAAGGKPPIPALGSSSERICRPFCWNVSCICRATVHDELRRIKAVSTDAFMLSCQCAIHGFIFARPCPQCLFQTVQRLCHVVRNGVVRPDVQHFLDTPSRIAGIISLSRLSWLSMPCTWMLLLFLWLPRSPPVDVQFVVIHNLTLFSFPLFGLFATVGIIFLLAKGGGTIGPRLDDHARQGREDFTDHYDGSRHWQIGTAGFCAEKCNPHRSHSAEWWNGS